MSNLKTFLGYVDDKKSKLEQLERDYRTTVQGLYRKDGQPKYSNAEMRERKEKALDKALGEIEHIAQDRIPSYKNTANIWREQAESFDLLDSVTSDVLEGAATMAPFVKYDCETLPLTILVSRMRDMIRDDGGISFGMKEKAFLYARFLPERLEKADATRSGEPGLSEAHQMVEAITDALGGRKAKKLQRDAETLERAIFELEQEVTVTKQNLETGATPEQRHRSVAKRYF